MDADALQRAWVAQAQADAERGVLECRMCRRHGPLDDAVTLWRNGQLLFAICERCACSHDVVMRPNDLGVEIRGRTRGMTVVRGGT